MSLKGVPHQIVLVLWSTVLIDGAVMADELSTCLTVELQLLAWVKGAVQGHLL